MCLSAFHARQENTTVKTINVNRTEIITNNAQINSIINGLSNTSGLEAAGYGGINITAGVLTSNTHYQSNINVANSNLTSTGNITFTANTEGDAKTLNNLDAAGAIEVVVSESDVNNTFDNSVNINKSKITADGDVTAAAYDRTTQRYQTIANIQGGAAGVAGAEEKNSLTRVNSVNLVNSSINADNVNLNSG